ncbi:MAG: DNA-binding protein [Thermoanaerobaculia bacterium]|jgi:putative heme degradation protein|nr:DNA-binding protein [Thermoanaerobaculia bacterium]
MATISPNDRRRERFTERLTVRLRDAAAAVGVSEAAIRNEIKAGRLEARRLGRAVLVDAGELRRFVENLPPAA